MTSAVRRVFYDLEFLEDGRTIEPISLGMCDEGNRELYLINRGFALGRLVGETWLEANVVPYLPICLDDDRCYGWDTAHPDFQFVQSRARIALEVKRFLTSRASLPVELWGFFPAYDQVALAQLFGRLTDVPRGVPQRTRDVTDLYAERHRSLPPQTNPHHSLEDARWIRAAFQRCASERENGT